MAPSQLKQLKAQIHSRRNSSASATEERRNGRTSHQKTPSRFAPSHRSLTARERGDELRRLKLLPELEKRHKSGGIVDRRIGENDPGLTPEQKALERYARQRSKRESVFNLEDDADESIQLTHLGRSLDPVRGESDARAPITDENFDRPSKRRRVSEESNTAGWTEETQASSEPPKSKKEVYKEIIAKSKLHKYERQKAKEIDENTRDELDKTLPDILSALHDTTVMSISNTDTANMLKRSDAAGKEYDDRVRAMALDKRSHPTDRTMTQEEKAEEEAERLKMFEEKRQRRMRGQSEQSEQSESTEDGKSVNGSDADPQTEAAEFGLKSLSNKRHPAERNMLDAGAEDEDDFIIEEDLVANDSDVEDGSSLDDSDVEEEHQDEDEDFLSTIKDDTMPVHAQSERLASSVTSKTAPYASVGSPYMFPCPRDHAGLLHLLNGSSSVDTNIMIQRVRTLYHVSLDASNKAKLSDFSSALVDHIFHLGRSHDESDLDTVEQMIRHIHSMARNHLLVNAISETFRSHLRRIQDNSSGSIHPGDLHILTAIGSIFPPSDHFHPVATPAFTVMARWLGTSGFPVADLECSRIGSYLVTLCVRYQQLSKRYVPELVRWTVDALRWHCALDDKRGGRSTEPEAIIRSDRSSCHRELSTACVHLQNLSSMCTMWRDHASFPEIFADVEGLISKDGDAFIATLPDSAGLEFSEKLAGFKQLYRRHKRLSGLRQPLQEHNHRPLPIRMQVPQFDPNFQPYHARDQRGDRDMAEQQRLKREYRREKKGAARELRRDAEFLAREGLKAKRERDAAHAEKQRKLIAEIQGEEGAAKNEYEREKEKSKKPRRR